MIIEFDHKKATVTFGGGRFCVLFVHRGFINKVLEIQAFEADKNKFLPLDPSRPLFVKKIPFDDHKMANTLEILKGLDDGTASWIPDQFLSRDKDSKEVQELEEKAAQGAFGKARTLLGQKDYEAAVLNITASLLSKYLKEHPKYESKFLSEQATAYAGLNKYSEAKKAFLMALKKKDGDPEVEDYFTLGCLEYKLSNSKEAIENLKKFIELARSFLENSKDSERNAKLKNTIELSNGLINKLGMMK